VYIDADDLEFTSNEPDIEECLSHLAAIDELKAVLKKMPSKYGDVLEMRYFQDLNDREISDILGITPDSVRVYLSRARTIAHKLMMEQRGGSHGTEY
jgi:RNA polymerase sigma-70 factor (ECF subfamily)